MGFVGPRSHVRERLRGSMPPEPLATAPTIALPLVASGSAQEAYRQSKSGSQGEVPKVPSIPRRATRDRTFARPNIASGSANERSHPPHQTDLSVRGSSPQLSCSRSSSKRLIVSTSDDIP